MRLDRADRRRLAFASTLTVAALPAVWLVNRDDTRSSTTRPNVAAVGLAAEDASAGQPDGAAASRASFDPMGDGDPLFARRAAGRAGAAGAAPWRSAAPTKSSRLPSRRTADRSAPATRCPYNGLPAGTSVKVVNPANGRSIECVTSPSDDDELVLHPDRFVAARQPDRRTGARRDPPVTDSSRPAVRDLLTSRGLAPRRDLGQNFVADPNTVRRIAHLAAVGPGDQVVEIGAGLGSLTLALAETGADVTAIEVDHGLVRALADVVGELERVTVVEADAMTVDWADLLGDHDHWVLVANLPYNVATPLVADLLDRVPAIDRMLVMVQREVAERLAAGAG